MGAAYVHGGRSRWGGDDVCRVWTSHVVPSLFRVHAQARSKGAQTQAKAPARVQFWIGVPVLEVLRVWWLVE